MRDGRRVRGFCDAFAPRATVFVLDGEEDGEARLIDIRAVKAVFGVKRFEGDPLYRDDAKAPYSARYGRPTLVEFVDGEVMRGYAQGLPLDGVGFFMFPCDPQSNNLWVYIAIDAVLRVRFGARSASVAVAAA
jgi:hypothetical protein